MSINNEISCVNEKNQQLVSCIRKSEKKNKTNKNLFYLYSN